MRITERTYQNNFLRGVSKNQTEIERLQRQMEYQTKIFKPSDSPIGAAKSVRLNDQIKNNEKYMENIENSYAFLQETTTALDSIHTNVQELITMFPTISNATYKDQYNEFADKIDMALDTILNFANQEFDGKYLFGGTDFAAAPYGDQTPPPATPPPSRVIELKTSGTTGTSNVNIGKSLTQSINVKGDDVFGVMGTNDIFNTLVKISDDLRAGNPPTEADMQIVEDFEANVLTQSSKAGNTVNQLLTMKDALESQNLELTELYSNENDVDMTEAALELETYQYNLEVSYKIAAKIMPTSLLDYL
ncbi:MAG TPA: hypothetical protein VHP30_11360 [Ignavibacteriales bacterium]|nr:hypothetical protein [Ignavibacteriales bacterium]